MNDYDDFFYWKIVLIVIAFMGILTIGRFVVFSTQYEHGFILTEENQLFSVTAPFGIITREDYFSGVLGVVFGNGLDYSSKVYEKYNIKYIDADNRMHTVMFYADEVPIVFDGKFELWVYRKGYYDINPEGVVEAILFDEPVDDPFFTVTEKDITYYELHLPYTEPLNKTTTDYIVLGEK